MQVSDRFDATSRSHRYAQDSTAEDGEGIGDVANYMVLDGLDPVPIGGSRGKDLQSTGAPAVNNGEGSDVGVGAVIRSYELMSRG